MTDTIDAAHNLADDMSSVAKKAVGDQSLIGQAQAAVTNAFDATMEAVQEHPLAAIGIAAGAAAVVAGTVFGTAKVLGDSVAEPKKK